MSGLVLRRCRSMLLLFANPAEQPGLGPSALAFDRMQRNAHCFDHLRMGRTVSLQQARVHPSPRSFAVVPRFHGQILLWFSGVISLGFLVLLWQRVADW